MPQNPFFLDFGILMKFDLCSAHDYYVKRGSTTYISITTIDLLRRRIFRKIRITVIQRCVALIRLVGF